MARRLLPEGPARRRELEHVASRLTAVEVNGTFYSLQRRTTFERWASEVPEDFVFALKGSRYVTHLLRLVGVRTTAEAAVLAQGLARPRPALELDRLRAPPRPHPPLRQSLQRFLPGRVGAVVSQAVRRGPRRAGVLRQRLRGTRAARRRAAAPPAPSELTSARVADPRGRCEAESG
ncbi:hypothetical protein GCM10009725_30690 [Aeromicrobium tamlense]